MKKFSLIMIGASLALCAFISVNNNKKEISTVAAGNDSLIYPGENHFASLRQLTFGGDNAEAYFSFDSKKLSFQSNPAQPGKARRCVKTASMPSRLPAMVPLMPSFGKSNDPLTPCARQSARSGPCNKAGSEKRVK